MQETYKGTVFATVCTQNMTNSYLWECKRVSLYPSAPVTVSPSRRLENKRSELII